MCHLTEMNKERVTFIVEALKVQRESALNSHGRQHLVLSKDSHCAGEAEGEICLVVFSCLLF